MGSLNEPHTGEQPMISPRRTKYTVGIIVDINGIQHLLPRKRKNGSGSITTPLEADQIIVLWNFTRGIKHVFLLLSGRPTPQTAAVALYLWKACLAAGLHVECSTAPPLSDGAPLLPARQASLVHLESELRWQVASLLAEFAENPASQSR
jgi:hypothetical protein